jgi:hypothetical protein
MAVPVLKINLAPPSNYWRLNHILLSWAALAVGALILAGALGFTWKAYHDAAASGKLALSLANKTRSAADTQSRIMEELRNVDVAKELPRWRLAERIYTERSLPWSRLTAELERTLAKDVRIKAVQRNRSADMKVQLKIKGEARTREAEAAFVEALQKDAFFDQVILEREAERQGGGVDFDYTLAVNSTPPPYQPLPKSAPQAPAKAPVKTLPGAPAKAPAAAPAKAPTPGPSGIAVPPPQARPAPAAPPPAAPEAPANQPTFRMPGMAPHRRPFPPNNQPGNQPNNQPGNAGANP